MGRPLTSDPFLSAVLDKPAVRVTSPESLTPEMFQNGEPGFGYAKVGVRLPGSAAILQAFGFRLVDTNVQLDRPILGDWGAKPLAPGYEVRGAEDGDQVGVEVVAGASFIYSRFHLDPGIPNETAGRIKAEWAGNYFQGKRGDQMVVAVFEGEPVGFLQLLIARDTLIIDLIAVAKAHQGKGLATAMIQFAARRNASLDRLLVGTQIANTPSLRAYEKLGFRVCDASYVFHYHGPISPEAIAA